MTVFGHVCGYVCEVKQGPAFSVKTKKRWHPYHICVSEVSTVTGIRRVGVAILVIVIVFELSYLCGVSKVSTVTGIRRVAVAIHVLVVKSVNSHRDQACRGRHPRNCHRF